MYIFVCKNYPAELQPGSLFLTYKHKSLKSYQFLLQSHFKTPKDMLPLNFYLKEENKMSRIIYIWMVVFFFTVHTQILSLMIGTVKAGSSFSTVCYHNPSAYINSCISYLCFVEWWFRIEVSKISITDKVVNIFVCPFMTAIPNYSIVLV